jgi:hypothetical protein
VAGIFNDIHHFIYNHARIGSFSFWVMCIVGGGIAGILPDIDHVPKYVLRLPIPGRLLHLVFLIIGCYGIARFGRLYNKLVLEEKTRVEITNPNLNRRKNKGRNN